MKETIVIPIKIERVKRWTRWMLEAAGWLVCLGLLAAGAGIGGAAMLIWLFAGSEAILMLGMACALPLGLAGAWQLLRRLERAAGLMRNEEPAS